MKQTEERDGGAEGGTQNKKTGGAHAWPRMTPEVVFA